MDKAQALEKKAEKKLKGGGFISSWFVSKNDKQEEAAELYVEASKYYKIDGKCKVNNKCSERSPKLPSEGG